MHVEPKVCVLTPVYNGAQFLAEAIDSVRSQTYHNWVHIIADNCSTDETVPIAEHFAALDPRIRVVRADTHLPVIANWNRAHSHVPADCAYVKELHADDLLMPNCLAELTAILERHPSAAIASSYEMYDSAVSNTGVPRGQSLLRGSTVIARTLTNQWYLFGSPSTILLRADLVRAAGGRFYDEDLRHADLDACIRMIEDRDFAFVHQVLSCTRTHGASETNNFTARFSTIVLEQLGFVRKYGPRHLDPAMYRQAHRLAVRRWRRRFARRIIGGGGLEYWRYHRARLASFGYRVSPLDFAIGVGTELALWAIDLRHAAHSARKLTLKLRARFIPNARSHRLHEFWSRRHFVLRETFYRSWFF